MRSSRPAISASPLLNLHEAAASTGSRVRGLYQIRAPLVRFCQCGGSDRLRSVASETRTSDTTRQRPPTRAAFLYAPLGRGEQTTLSY